MTVEEMQKSIDQLKAEGNSEDAILGSFYKMFQNDKLTLDQLEGIVNLMGYHLKDEFKAMSPEDQKTKGYEEINEPAEGVDKEEIEEAKEDDKGEKPEAEDKPAEDKKPEEGAKEDNKEEDSEEEAKAMKMFGV